MLSFHLKKILSLFIILFTLNCALVAQEQRIQYHVFHNGNRVGLVNLYQKRSGEALFLKMISDIKVKMLLDISVLITEESHFLQGKLQYSRLHRSVNGKDKAKRQTSAVGNAYHTLADGKKGIINQSAIDYNLIQLYCFEPINKSRVYSDNFQRFLPIKVTGKNVYRIDLPDGNYNEFTYKSGLCTDVSIHSALYTIHLKRA